MADKPVRVRFAPSPTGYLHIGGARTALLNWLFARASGGTFILRIEDTDQNRYTEGAVEGLIEGLEWLGMTIDEGPHVGGDYGPYIQSQRVELYQKWAHWLVEQGKAYRCYATKEELDHAREVAEKTTGKKAGYERLHRNLSDAERAKLEAERGSYVIRFAMPLDGQTTVYDRVRGKIVVDNSELNDTVLLKSDGFPTYHLAMAVDDHFMEISHVMRSDEWLPSLPLHQQLYDAFGWESPEWVHLPVVLNPDGKKKMSKRKPPVDDKGNPVPIFVHEYKAAGYLPEALVNFLTNVGYSFGDDREVFTVEETIGRFDLSRINPASAAFPVHRLYWLNGVYIRELSAEDLAERVRPFLEAAYGEIDIRKVVIIAPHIRERVNPLSAVVGLLKFLFDFEPPAPQELIQKKMDAAGTVAALDRSYETLAAMDGLNPTEADRIMRALVEEMGLGVGQVFGALRVATTNQSVSPPLFESMEAMGKDEALRRIRDAKERLAATIPT